MKGKLYNQVKHILVVFLLVCSVLGSYAQNKQGAKISDTMGTSLPTTSALLELESTTKGFLLPRMTTLQRDLIVIDDKIRGNGLAIYNIDTNCINYWSKKTNEWLSICGKMMPAIVKIGDCNKTKLSASGIGTLKQGKYLSETDILYVELNILKPGTVDIKVSSDNGYFFTGAGEYTSEGLYMIALSGMGTPVNSAAAPGNKMKFVVNGNELTCDFSIEVTGSGVDYTVTQNPFALANGEAYIGKPLTPAINKVSVNVNVIEKGYWRIESTTTESGVSLSGSGNFTGPGPQAVELVVQGTPTQSGDLSFYVKTNSKTDPLPTQIVVKVVVKPVDFTTLCGSSTYSIESVGKYVEDSQIDSNNYIQMPITVKGSGKATITLKAEGQNASGVKIQDLDFIAKDVNLVMGQNVDNVQFVYLKAPNERLNKGVVSIVFKSISTNPNTTVPLVLCTELKPIAVNKQPINYSLACSSIKVIGNYFVDKAIDGNTQYIELDVKSNYLSPYVIQTNEIDGVSFKATGTFTVLGAQKIKLVATGKFVSGGNKQFKITTDSDVDNTTCSASINVTYRDVNILYLGHLGYGPTTNNTYSASRIINNKALFGPNGKMRVNNVNLFSSASMNAQNLKSFLISNKIDIIFLAYHYNMDTGSVAVFEEFVKNQNGFMVYADELYINDSDKGLALMNKMSGVTGVTANSSGESYVNNYDFTTNAATIKPLVDGSFGKIEGSDRFGLDALHAFYVILPKGSNLIPLAVHPTKTDNVIFGMHKTLGFIFIGDGGWAAGDVTNRSNNIFPAKVDSSNVPIRKDDYGTNPKGTVTNAILYANVMEYAIRYVAKNKNDWKMN